MRWPIFILLLAAATYLEMGALSLVTVGAAAPDPYLVLLCYLVLYAPSGQLPAACWLTGLAKDIAFGTRVGIFALVFLAAGAAAGALRDRPLRARVILHLVLSFAVSLAVGLGSRALAGLFRVGVPEAMAFAARGEIRPWLPGLWHLVGTSALVAAASLAFTALWAAAPAPVRLLSRDPAGADGPAE